MNAAVEKQPEIINRFKKIINNKHLSHAYLLTGASGTGKKDVATWVAMRLFCDNLVDDEPCQKCDECQRILTNQHPDVVEVVPDGQSIKVDQVRFLKAEFSKSGVEGAQKVFIINHANLMTTSAANSLLKFIEEPAGQVTAFLLAENKGLILPTIVSRTEIIEMKPLQQGALVERLVEQGFEKSTARVLVNLTNDSEEIKALTDEDWIKNAQPIVEKWFLQVTKADLSSFVMVQNQIMDYANGPLFQNKILDMMMLYSKSVLDLKFTQPVEFLDQVPTGLQELADQGTLKQLLMTTDILMDLPNKLKQNLNFQSFVEEATLKICDIFQRRG